MDERLEQELTADPAIDGTTPDHPAEPAHQDSAPIEAAAAQPPDAQEPPPAMPTEAEAPADTTEPAAPTEATPDQSTDSDDEADANEPAAAVMTAEDLLGDTPSDQPTEASSAEATLRAVIEAVIYVTEEPLTVDQIAAGLDITKERVQEILKLIEIECARPERGVSVREVAGGYKMGTKPEHHEAIRAFVKKLRPPFKLSLAALETLAVIAYKQPITAPEIMEVRGVQGAGVVKTLLDRKLITPAGRKQVVGKPILYKTTKEFLLQFGLKDLAELPTLKEFEELRRLVSDDDVTPLEAQPELPLGVQPEPSVTVEPAPEPKPTPEAETHADAEPPPPAEPVETPDPESKPEAPAEPGAPTE